MVHWIREHFPDLPKLLADVRQRPAVHLGEKSLLALEHQLYGINFAEDFHGVPEGDRFGGFDLAAFEKWVNQTLNAERLNVRSFYLARHAAGSDAAGFDLWFEWYDRYRGEVSAAAATG